MNKNQNICERWAEARRVMSELSLTAESYDEMDRLRNLLEFICRDEAAALAEAAAEDIDERSFLLTAYSPTNPKLSVNFGVIVTPLIPQEFWAIEVVTMLGGEGSWQFALPHVHFAEKVVVALVEASALLDGPLPLCLAAGKGHIN